jgi:hypothetical protein
MKASRGTVFDRDLVSLNAMRTINAEWNTGLPLPAGKLHFMP